MRQRFYNLYHYQNNIDKNYCQYHFIEFERVCFTLKCISAQRKHHRMKTKIKKKVKKKHRPETFFRLEILAPSIENFSWKHCRLKTKVKIAKINALFINIIHKNCCPKNQNLEHGLISNRWKLDLMAPYQETNQWRMNLQSGVE